MDKARTAITQHRGDPSNRRPLLGFFEIQFGLFRGQTFRWVAENSLGYAAYLVAAMNIRSVTCRTPHSSTGKEKRRGSNLDQAKCNKDRKPPAHLQYFGNWYCQESETQSYEEWRAVLEQRGYGGKKRGDAP
ncbi:hypothetical protein NQZ68_039591 [Dissostichus eleginoides]|nr:hypothetical protein NQZ68_039591 [Dissostichus eleginoides]